MPRTVNIHQAKTHLSRLLEDVRRGETITIAKAGEPVARLTPIPRADVVFGAFAGQFSYDDRDFLEPDPDVLRLFDEELEVEAP